MAIRKTIRIKPVEGRRVMLLSNQGLVIDRPRDVPAHSYYHRAIARGDLALVEATKTAPKRRAKKES